MAAFLAWDDKTVVKKKNQKRGTDSCDDKVPVSRKYKLNKSGDKLSLVWQKNHLKLKLWQKQYSSITSFSFFQTACLRKFAKFTPTEAFAKS